MNYFSLSQAQTIQDGRRSSAVVVLAILDFRCRKYSLSQTAGFLLLNDMSFFILSSNYGPELRITPRQRPTNNAANYDGINCYGVDETKDITSHWFLV